jgi:hypothetical protein
VRHPQATENPQPEPAEKTQKDSNQKESPIDKAWRHWMSRFFTDIKITDALLALFTGLLALYTFRLSIATHETREIALASLGRPHIFFEFIYHNFNEWREGRANRPLFCYSRITGPVPPSFGTYPYAPCSAEDLASTRSRKRGWSSTFQVRSGLMASSTGLQTR